MLRKIPKFIETIIPIVISMMLELEDSPNWNEENDDHDDIDITNSDIGEEALDRLAIAFGKSYPIY